MKELIGISAIAILFGIADASAEERTTGSNILPVAQKNARYYSRQRYRRLGYRQGPYGSVYRRRGPYVQYWGPGGPTGPIPPTITGD
jgi:hypothetical protein